MRRQRESLGERLGTVRLDRRSLLAQQLADQEGVAVVVLDEQHPNQVARHPASVRGPFRTAGAASATSHAHLRSVALEERNPDIE